MAEEGSASRPGGRCVLEIMFPNVFSRGQRRVSVRYFLWLQRLMRLTLLLRLTLQPT